jgi:hypothetical protein
MLKTLSSKHIKYLQHENKAQVTLVAFINGVAPIEIYITFRQFWGNGPFALIKSS